MAKIILVGFMGSGKTTIGKKLAKALGVPFIDADQEIEKWTEMTIGEIFSVHGESYFRGLERTFITTLPDEDFVLSTGGGMPCVADHMQLLNEIGTTLYLKRSPKELVHRLRNAKSKRPLIEGLEESELLEYVEAKLAEREEYYRQAHFVLDREEQNAETIIRYLQPQKNA
jgi:shikimate kinase